MQTQRVYLEARCEYALFLNASGHLGICWAAIGLTEETDAIVIVISEEEGAISMVREGRITRAVDAGTLRSTLQKLFSS